MKIASWNVNSLNVRLPHLLEWLKIFEPDVLVLQETKQDDSKFPQADIEAAGYHVVFDGQKTYNGVAILSKTEMQDVQKGIPGFADEQKRALAATINGVRVIDLYVVNGQSVGSEKYDYKLRWFEAMHQWVQDELTRHQKLVVLGDFNIAPDERDVHDPVVWNEDSILTSTQERSALQRLMALGLHDSFRLHSDDAGVFSWWDYRMAGFRRNLGLRIDLVLISEALKEQAKASGIEREPRTWERPSDHAPVWVEIN
ncbi:MAG TPA: exodeoxyribonuclease III [Arenimonas sp.]|nr:exodeoxyribonuclease III [Arenimonas sp.]